MNKDSETKMENCQVCGHYICKCSIEEFAPPDTITLRGNAPCPTLCPHNECIKMVPPETSSWDEKLEKLMPKTSEETMSYGQFCAIRKLFRSVATSEYKRGRQSILDEWNHEKEKFTDGFNHPKDCRICLLAITDEK